MRVIPSSDPDQLMEGKVFKLRKDITIQEGSDTKSTQNLN